MSTWSAQEAREIAITSTDKAEDFGRGCTGFMVCADTDCYINFDSPAISGGGSLLIKANLVPVYIPAMANTIHVIGSNGKLYVIAFRQKTGR